MGKTETADSNFRADGRVAEPGSALARVTQMDLAA